MALLQQRYSSLTPRERDVMEHVVAGQLNKQIAFDLGTGEQTIKVHRGRVMEKMGVDSLAGLVRAAERLGLRKSPHRGPGSPLRPRRIKLRSIFRRRHRGILGPMATVPPLIAVLDDEPQFCKALGRLLKTHGLEVSAFACGQDLLAACALRQPNCLLLDLHMPDMNGFQVLERLRQLRMPVPVITLRRRPAGQCRTAADSRRHRVFVQAAE